MCPLAAEEGVLRPRDYSCNCFCSVAGTYLVAVAVTTCIFFFACETRTFRMRLNFHNFDNSFLSSSRCAIHYQQLAKRSFRCIKKDAGIFYLVSHLRLQVTRSGGLEP